MESSNLLRRIITAVVAPIGAATALYAQSPWVPDTVALGPTFENLTIPLHSDHDIPCTIIRATRDANSRHAAGVLYIHGFNDYFFQAEMADSFANHGIAFYAIDLQRYGRSLRPGQIHCDCRHGLDEYFPAIDSALTVMRQSGVRIITLMGHSTGGLIASYYLAKNPDSPVANLVLNSPFLAWNLGKLNRLMPIVSAIGAIAPGLKFSQGDSDAYASSVLASRHGRWTYNESWKLVHSPDVTAGWLRSITRAQNYLKNHPGCIKVPTLLMTSRRAFHGSSWEPAADSADAVLNPTALRKIGITLPADGATNVVVNGGLHDLILSRTAVTRPLYRFLFNWIKTQDMTYVKNGFKNVNTVAKMNQDTH